jgi:catechol 2,3-dioxygenase-like lactoylglutathione lyase family enzyme
METETALQYDQKVKGGITTMTQAKKVEPVDMKLEVVVLSVSDVDRAKAFYENLGWRLDIDIAAGDFRGVQMTPHNSEASIIFGKGDHLGEAWRGGKPGPRRGQHRRPPALT